MFMYTVLLAMKIEYSEQDNEILTAMRFRPNAASRNGNREKFTPGKNPGYTHRLTELVAHQNR